jgi:hypothetical protein
MLMQLAAIAYDAKDFVRLSVDTHFMGRVKVVWGPEEAYHVFGVPVPYSAAFIAHGPGEGQYTVVIRGTEANSLMSWVTEDFEVGPVPFSQFAANAPPNAMISKGTSNGLKDLLSLGQPGNGIVDFLSKVSPTTLYVTGHSLGGTLTPALFAYLNYRLRGGEHVDDMAPCSFAGLTAGNREFNDYFNGLFTCPTPWRFYNTLDIAPILWHGTRADLEQLYELPGLNLPYEGVEAWALDTLLRDAKPVGYEQPGGDYALAGTPDTSCTSWIKEALAQHHHGAYLTLVNREFQAAPPVPAAVQPQSAPLA